MRTTKKLPLLLIIFILSFVILKSPQGIAQTPGTLDATFNPASGANGGISTTAIQSDGKIIIGGVFNRYNGVALDGIARLNTNGTLDSTFFVGSGAKLLTSGGEIITITIQSDGKIIIGGNFTSYNGVARNYIARLNANGTLDNSFITGTGTDGYILTSAIQSDGKIIIGGNFTMYNGTAANYIARLNSDGTLDNTFTIGTGTGADNFIWTSVLQNDGKIIIGGAFTSYNGTGVNYIARLNTDGSIDTAFHTGTGANNFVNTIVVQNDNNILIGGNFTMYNGTGAMYLARLKANGNVDSVFANLFANHGASVVNNYVEAIALQSDGSIIIGGYFTSGIVHLSTSGYFDPYFNAGNPGIGGVPTPFVRTLAIQSNDNIIIGGTFTTYNGTGVNYISHLRFDGILLNGFTLGSGAGPNSTIATSVIQSDGKIIIGGNFNSYNGTGAYNITRLNVDGTLDNVFNQRTAVEGIVRTSSIQSNGQIVIGGDFIHGGFWAGSTNRIARLNVDGTADPSFTVGTGTDSTVFTTTIQSDGKIIIGGVFTHYNGTAINRIARLNVDGTIDTTFKVGTGPNNTVRTSAIQIDGKIIVGGLFTGYNGTASNRVARLNVDGSLDNTFTVGTGADSSVYTTAIQSDGRIIIGGVFTNYNGTAKSGIVRLNTNGTADNAFNYFSYGLSGTDRSIFTSSVQSNGKIIIGGRFTSYNGTSILCIARLNSNGTLDNTFNVGTGANNNVYTSAIQSNGEIIIGGNFTVYNGAAKNYLARITGVCIPPKVTSTTPQARCGPGTITFGATSSTDSLVWFSGITGGAPLGSGTSFTTPWLTATTTYYVEAANALCASPRTAVTATVHLLPTVTANASASTFCSNSGGSITLTGGGASTYAWTGAVSDGVAFIPLSTATYTVTGTDAYGCTNTAPKTITVNNPPGVSAHASLTNVCAGTAVTLTGSGANSYTWSGSVTNGVAFAPAASATYSVTGTDANGCSNTDAIGIIVNAFPDTAGIISGLKSVCQGDIQVSYSIPSIKNANSYTWVLPAGYAISTGANTNSITVNFSMSTAQSGTIKVRGENTCGSGVFSTDYPVTVNSFPGLTRFLSGDTAVCQGETGVRYVAHSNFATSYNWTMPSGASIVSGVGTDTILVNFSGFASSGIITTKGINSCGSSTLSAPFALSVNPLPDAASTILGSPAVCHGQNGINYFVSSINHATNYVWTLPIGATIVSGNNTNSIYIDFSSSAISGNVSVYASNTCGKGLASAAYPVFIKSLPGSAGAIAGAAIVCQGQNSVAYTIPAIDSATDYVWSLPNGAIIVSGNHTNTIVVNYSNTSSSGSISVYGSNSCGIGSASSVNIAVNPLPAAAGAISGPVNIVSCPTPLGIKYSVNASANANYYKWGLPKGVSIVAGDSTSTITVDFSSTAISDTIHVFGVNSCGNGISSLFVFTVNPFPGGSPSICEVTVDTGSTHNIIYWDKTGFTNVDTFLIQREIKTNSYATVGKVPYPALSEYHDYGANPNSGTYRYKIGLIDKCGNRYDTLSPFHNTTYITSPAPGQFQWAGTEYLIQGQSNFVSYYVLYRDNLSNGNWIAVDSCPGTQFVRNDPNYSLHPQARYHIETIWGISCSPTARTTAAYSTTKSNIKASLGVSAGITSQSFLAGMKMYPNPSNSQLNLEYLSGYRNYRISIFNMLGDVVYIKELNGLSNGNSANIEHIDVSGFASGIYSLSIQTETLKVFKKLIVK